MKPVILLLTCLSIILSGCATSPAIKNISAKKKTSITANKAAAISIALPDGEIITGIKLMFSDGKGAFYVGEVKNKNVPHGKGAVFFPVATDQLDLTHSVKYRSIRTGQFREGISVGLHKIFNPINALVTFSIFENNKIIKSYGELDVLLASGDYETAFKKRGKKVFVGLELQKLENQKGIGVKRTVYNSPGEIAGFKAEDIVLALNNVSTEGDSLEVFLRKLVSLPFGQKVSFKVLRQGRTFDISFVPGIIPENYSGVESTKSLLWKSIKQKNSSSAYQKYLDTVMDKTFHAQARAALKIISAKEKTAFKKHKSQGIAGLIAFCKQYPDSLFLGKELPALYTRIESNGSFIKQYSKLVNDCSTAKKYQPAYYQLLNIGPVGMTVKDALILSSKGTGAELIATKIKYSNQQYKDFKFDELAHLASFGLHDKIVAAMLESTYKKEQKTAEEYKKRAEKLAAENKRMKAEASRQKKLAAIAPKKVEKNSMPLECLKLVAALKACDKASGFLSMGCEAVARSSFDCPLPMHKLMH